MENAKKSSACIFCHRTFARSDALKRHWNTCRVRKNHAMDLPTIKPKTRGRKLRACDLCNRLRRACNSTKPCTPCALRNLNCTYSRSHLDRTEQGHHEEHQSAPRCVTTKDTTSDLGCHESITGILEVDDDEASIDVSSDGASSAANGLHYRFKQTLLSLDCWNASKILLDEHTFVSSICARPTQLDFRSLNQFPFLDNFTKSTGFITSFQCGTREQRLSVVAGSSGSRFLNSFGLDCDNSGLETHWAEITRLALVSHNDCDMRDVVVDALLPKTHEIVSAIREVSVMKNWKDSIDANWSTQLEALCYGFFHPASLRKHLALFWSCWYPNWPVMHQPTFDVTKKSPSLVAAMALVGACLSPNERDNATAQIWMNLVEEMVFSNDIFGDPDLSIAWQTLGSAYLRKAHLDILQAAYCVCLYQTWEGCKRSKRRILRQRFSHLVYLARDIGLEQASLRAIDTSHPSAFNFEEYSIRESLIRIFLYICNIDASYTLFFRNPPRMSFSELNIELASPQSCFQAQTKEECFVELKTWRSKSCLGVKNFTIRTAVEALSSPTISATGRQIFSQLSVLNMFTLVHALCLQVYHIQSSGTQPSLMTKTNPVVIALRHWKSLWPSPTRDAELMGYVHEESRISTALRSIGFIKHAPEYWLLLFLSLQRSSENPLTTLYSASDVVVRHEDMEMDEAQSLIAELKTLKFDIDLL